LPQEIEKNNFKEVMAGRKSGRSFCHLLLVLGIFQEVAAAIVVEI